MKIRALFVGLVIAAQFCLSVHAQAQATVAECYVDVTTVLVYSDGSVNVRHSGRGDFTVICNLNFERLGVSPLTCATWTSMLQSLKRAGERANFYYALDSRFTSCADVPTYWSAPAPIYIGTAD